MSKFNSEVAFFAALPEEARREIVDNYVNHAPEAMGEEYQYRTGCDDNVKDWIVTGTDVVHKLTLDGFMIGGIFCLVTGGRVAWKCLSGARRLWKTIKK